MSHWISLSHQTRAAFSTFRRQHICRDSIQFLRRQHFCTSCLLIAVRYFHIGTQQNSPRPYQLLLSNWASVLFWRYFMPFWKVLILSTWCPHEHSSVGTAYKDNFKQYSCDEYCIFNNVTNDVSFICER